MKEIKLTQDKVAVVDDEDYEWLSLHKWCVQKGRNTFYAVRSTRKSEDGLPITAIMMHRAILEKHASLQPEHETDHRSGDGLDNQRSNLRSVTTRQNQQNQVNRSKQSSKFPGVHWNKRAGKWQSRITINGKRKHLGYFDNEEDAALAYIVALKQIDEIIIGE